MSRMRAEKLLEQVSGWNMVNEGELKIGKEYKFKNFKLALAFVNQVGDVAEKEGHHPDIHLGWGRVKIVSYTHAVSGLSDNDFILAARIDKLQ